ncbi:hypothetical protein [Aquimarina sp. 2304DJ70-9]|uniref:hypothetical protein n=1 Tax=Aquimarina penaris TaxID=3231044 RepID=UPI0034629D4F
MEKEQLYKQIDTILWRDWDPIGINNIAPDDEYRGYVPSVYNILVGGTNVKGLSDLLFKFETTTIGMPGNREKCDMVAEKLLKLLD